MALQNKVAAEQTVKSIEAVYGPFSEDEIRFYKNRLATDGGPIINNFQRQLIGYMFYKDFGDPITFMSIHNYTDFIKLIIASKKILLDMGMVLLPYIISSKVLRNTTRKNISKKDVAKYEQSQSCAAIKDKYRNEKVSNKAWEFIASVASSSFEIIDYDKDNKCAGKLDKVHLPMVSEIICEEMAHFINMI